MKDNVNKREILDKIIPIIENMTNQQGLIPLEVDFLKESGKWYLRIFIFRYGKPISHKDCEELTRRLDEYLDQLIPVPYYLEVSSPGTERKLKSTREYNIFKGKKVEIKLKQPLEDNMKIFVAELIEYLPESGLNVRVIENNADAASRKIINIDEKNISSVKLKAEYKI